MLICLRKANYVIEANTLQRGLQLLTVRLPPGWKVSLVRSPAPRGPDAIWEIAGPDNVNTRLAIEAKKRVFPRDVPALKAHIGLWPGPVLIVAAFLSPSTRQRLKEEDLNYLDTTGNLRLVLARPGLFVETRGADADPSPQAPPSRSLRGAKAGRLVRTLCDFGPPLPISDVAAKAGVDVSYASRVVEWLAREALVRREPRGPVVAVDRAALIRRWAEDYSVLTSNRAESYLDPRGLDNLQKGLARMTFRYAVTGSLAAVRLAPIAPARLGMIYVDDPDAAASELGLRPAEAGANVMLLAPFDRVVFERTRQDSGIAFVAPSQAVVDLFTSPGRAPSEAEALLDWLQREPV